MRHWRVMAGASALVLVAGVCLAQTAQIPALQLTPDQIKWQPYPAGGEQAFILGNPSRPGPYVLRVRFPPGLRIQPHTHSDARVVTVLSGTMYYSYGERFDTTRLRAYPAGSVWTERPGQPHFAWTRGGEVVLQAAGTGPSVTAPYPPKH